MSGWHLIAVIKRLVCDHNESVQIFILANSVFGNVRNSLTIQRIDTRHDNVQEVLSALREKLSPQGNMVSEAGRRPHNRSFWRTTNSTTSGRKNSSKCDKDGLSAVLKYKRSLMVLN